MELNVVSKPMTGVEIYILWAKCIYSTTVWVFFSVQMLLFFMSHLFPSCISKAKLFTLLYLVLSVSYFTLKYFEIKKIYIYKLNNQIVYRRVVEDLVKKL